MYNYIILQNVLLSPSKFGIQHRRLPKLVSQIEENVNFAWFPVNSTDGNAFITNGCNR